jgi:uncharacterized OsmC-like protein
VAGFPFGGELPLILAKPEAFKVWAGRDPLPRLNRFFMVVAVRPNSVADPRATARLTMMRGDDLRALQAPLKQRYRETPEAAVVTLKAKGEIGDETLTCKVETGRALVEAGLHPATGGDGIAACSGDMLLEALVACAGVTLKAVATALDIKLKRGSVSAEGDLDFRGTLGVAKDAPVGFRAIRLRFDLDTDASPDELATLLKLTERYCVVFQTLNSKPQLSIEHRRP